ncbi:MAG: class I SAM-dependent methyltransferase [Prevotella sp.]|nr:class I SAM-dependent methyltransferase [Prevotella sp.]
MKTAEFIELFANEDPATLALSADKFGDVDLPYALSQIEGRQTARAKIPSWAEHKGIIYPATKAMEQCSSEAAAMYKRSVVASILPLISGEKGGLMVDLTGGFGVDCAFLSPLFREVVYVERNPELCRTAEKNFKTLGLTNIKVICGDAEELFLSMNTCVFAYLDPDRRDAQGARKYALSDCSPDVTRMNTELLRLSRVVLVKCSPMLDWHKAVNDLTGVRQVHIVSSGNECKELLLVMSAESLGDKSLRIVCANDDQRFAYDIDEDERLMPDIATPLTETANGFLYVPNASLMKAGCFALLCRKYGMKMVAPNSHLFTSPDEIAGFPGRRFRICAVSPMNKRELKTHLAAIHNAAVAVRNFPLTADALRKRLKLADGNDVYIFGTTDAARRHLIIICERA